MEKVRAKMPPEQRAKQFLPFAGVRGLDEALALKEKMLGLDPEHVMAEDYLDLLNQKLRELLPGQKLGIMLDSDPAALREAVLTRVDWDAGSLICREGKYSFESIRDIKLF